MTRNIVKAFGASNLLIETGLRKIQEDYELDLGKNIRNKSSAPTTDVRMRFRMDVRRDSETMAQYYAIFYCIERETRELVRDRLSDAHGVDWWNLKVPEGIRNEVAARMKKEIESGIALRSTEPIDFTTFGELATVIDGCWDIFTDS